MTRSYSRPEIWLDGLIHLAGVTASVIATAFLLHEVVPVGDIRLTIVATVYAAGLVSVMGFSAAYNMTFNPAHKEAIRRFDHAAIFLMIAGSYTPFTIMGIGGGTGVALLVAVWTLACAGVFLKLAYPRRFERRAVALYLAIGWIGLVAIGQVITSLPASTLMLLGAGAVLYTVGVPFHLWNRLRCQNVIWHGFVLSAATCHYLAVLQTLAGS